MSYSVSRKNSRYMYISKCVVISLYVSEISLKISFICVFLVFYIVILCTVNNDCDMSWSLWHYENFSMQYTNKLFKSKNFIRKLLIFLYFSQKH